MTSPWAAWDGKELFATSMTMNGKSDDPVL
jgi:hypothetical protein